MRRWATTAPRSGVIGASAGEAVRPQERSLFVVHLVGELPKPVEAILHDCQRLVWKEVGAERQTHGRVDALSGVARVLDVALEFVDDDIGVDLVERDPVDSSDQWLREPDRPPWEIPQAVARATDPTGQAARRAPSR